MPVRLDHRFNGPLATLVGPCDPCVAALAGSERERGRSIPVLLIDGDDRRYATCARWGWSRADGGLSTHARVETAPSHPVWREACATRRAAVPVSGWWDADGWRYESKMPGEVLFLAGLWRRDDLGLAVALIDQPGLQAEAQDDGRLPIPLDLDLAANWITGLPMSRARSHQRTGLRVIAPP